MQSYQNGREFHNESTPPDTEQILDKWMRIVQYLYRDTHGVMAQVYIMNEGNSIPSFSANVPFQVDYGVDISNAPKFLPQDASKTPYL